MPFGNTSHHHGPMLIVIIFRAKTEELMTDSIIPGTGTYGQASMPAIILKVLSIMTLGIWNQYPNPNATDSYHLLMTNS